jgi:hypothetical protein
VNIAKLPELLAEAVISSVELIVQPDAKDAVGVVALGPAKGCIFGAQK